ncbi:hypothetical protein BHE74_00059759 [Ensete ventricosum]|nr:hypothetical protein BHE74_00059759 [Ensete ventricosum]
MANLLPSLSVSGAFLGGGPASPSPVAPAAAGLPSLDRTMASVGQLVLDLCDPELRENAIFDLSKREKRMGHWRKEEERGKKRKRRWRKEEEEEEEKKHTWEMIRANILRGGVQRGHGQWRLLLATCVRSEGIDRGEKTEVRNRGEKS